MSDMCTVCVCVCAGTEAGGDKAWSVLNALPVSSASYAAVVAHNQPYHVSNVPEWISQNCFVCVWHQSGEQAMGAMAVAAAHPMKATISSELFQLLLVAAAASYRTNVTKIKRLRWEYRGQMKLINSIRQSKLSMVCRQLCRLCHLTCA